MKAIDFTVSEHNSVSIVFIFYQWKLIMCSKGANRDYRYPVGAFFVFMDRYDMPAVYLFRKYKEGSCGQNRFCTQQERSTQYE